jgi:hypothetical protein
MFTTALRRLVESACLKLPFLRSSRNHQVDCGMRSIPLLRGCEKQKEFRKQDQFAILAQNILLCGKLWLEFFRDAIFRTRRHRTVKCRDGNCRGEGAARGCATTEMMKMKTKEKTLNHEGHEGSQRKNF